MQDKKEKRMHLPDASSRWWNGKAGTVNASSGPLLEAAGRGPAAALFISAGAGSRPADALFIPAGAGTIPADALFISADAGRFRWTHF